VVFAILSITSAQMNIDYFEMDPVTGVANQLAHNPMLFKAGFVRTKQKGDSLITYVATATDVYRVAANINNPTISSSSIAVPGMSYSGSVITGRKCTDNK
jgi:hypothetical protein